MNKLSEFCNEFGIINILEGLEPQNEGKQLYFINIYQPHDQINQKNEFFEKVQANPCQVFNNEELQEKIFGKDSPTSLQKILAG